MTIEDDVKTEIGNRDGPIALYCSARSPYDGCWHEPNYWLVKEDEVFPLYISGRAFDWWFKRDDPHPWLFPVDLEEFLGAMDDTDSYEEWEVIDLGEWELENYNVLNSVTAILSQHEVTSPKWTCTICDKECRGLAKLLGYRGNGGIGVIVEDPCCSDCFTSLRWCDSCHQYVTLELCEREAGGEWTDAIKCPNEDDDRHDLSDAEDEAEQFGLTGDRFLGPDGDAEGLAGICIVIAQKGSE